ncbi:ABC transporter permease [uncultured Victivallis sp.]|uniref:ABC transporter permease n=1 Tax=uncultured Victivallis sp. TaxID=354118 RepID=UPI0025E8B11C|nr:ABC transporter permease [uncultured Victivallis sp.]
MRTELFLAGRYLKPRRNAVSLITLLSILGVTLGVAVLIVVLAVMTGFTDLMKEKLVETQAHFQVRPGYGGVIYNPEEAIRAVEQAGGRAAAVIQSPVIVQRGRGLDPRVVLFGTSAEDLKKNGIFLPDTLKKGKLSLDKGEIIISTDQAARWGVGIGDKILLHTQQRLTQMVDFNPDGGVTLNKNASAYLPAEFVVTGIYSVGKYDFDRMILFAGIDDAADLLSLPWGSATAVFGWGPDAFDQKKLVETIRESLPFLRVVTWEEENQQLLGVLAVEKNMMFFLLIFIVLVAAFSIMNTLITSVYQKTHEIGILKALGASDRCVTFIFILQGFLIGVVGSVTGTLTGVLVIFYRNDIMAFASKTFHIELFPKQFYYFDGLPAHIVATDVLIIVGASVVLCTLGALLPALRAARLDPARALRYE